MPSNPHGFLPNFTLIYSGVLLSLGLRLFSDKLPVLFNTGNIIDLVYLIEPSLILACITLMYFVDDIIENTMFISSYSYNGTMRFYLDISICSIYYICVLMAIEHCKYYLLSFAALSLFVTIWCVFCKYRGTGPTRYLNFNRFSHTWCSIITILFFSWLLFNYDDSDTIIKFSLYYSIFWIIFYSSARVIVLRKFKREKYEGTEFLEAGLIMRIFIYIFDLTIPYNSQGSQKQ